MIPEPIQRFIDHQAERSPTDYSDLRAVFLNGTLKRSPGMSNTDGLMAVSIGLLRALDVRVDVVRTVDHVIPPGVQPDMREHGWERDDFPDIYREFVEPANIIVLATPICAMYRRPDRRRRGTGGVRPDRPEPGGRRWRCTAGGGGNLGAGGSPGR